MCSMNCSTFRGSFILYILIITSQVFAQGQAVGQWDPILAKYDQREYVYERSSWGQLHV